MFDYVTAEEVRLLSKLQLPGYKSSMSSNQRIRFELLGLIKDGPDGVQLTPKGMQVAKVGVASDERSEFLPYPEVEPLRMFLGKLLH